MKFHKPESIIKKLRRENWFPMPLLKTWSSSAALLPFGHESWPNCISLFLKVDERRRPTESGWFLSENWHSQSLCDNLCLFPPKEGSPCQRLTPHRSFQIPPVDTHGLPRCLLKNRNSWTASVKPSAPAITVGVSTTMIYTHVLNRGGQGIRNPVDNLWWEEPTLLLSSLDNHKDPNTRKTS